MARQAQANIHPIMSYSFLEYSESLTESDPYSALLYAQYALEHADVSAYFESLQSGQVLTNTDGNLAVTPRPSLDIKTLLVGIVIGILVSSIVFYAEKYFILRK